MSDALHQVTRALTADDLPRLVLEAAHLPAPLRHLMPSRSCFLDNHSLAEQGLPGSTAERFRDIGRLTGYLQEFLPAAPRQDPARVHPGGLHGGPPVRRLAFRVALDPGGLSAGLRIEA